MGAVKNIIKGSIMALITLVITILIPLLTFNYLRELPQVLGMTITLVDELWYSVAFWIIAAGIINVAFSFAKGSSPKRSKRKALFGMGKIFASCFYIYSYKFSGAASEMYFLIEGKGIIYFDLQNMLLLWMGLIFLKIIVEIYDFFDAIFYTIKVRSKLQDKKEFESMEDEK
ncbi:MAG: hypothetical protein ACTSWY_02460 [Promethearchaeota archaeon]